jgi:NAD(P)H-hydrate epimerase
MELQFCQTDRKLRDPDRTSLADRGPNLPGPLNLSASGTGIREALVTVRPLSVSGMIELDRKMIEDYRIDLLLMMENAGKALAVQSLRLLGSLRSRKILVLAGKGNNGGGGLASARHLHNWGADVEIVLSSSRTNLKDAPARQAQILETMGVPMKESVSAEEAGRFHLIIDALLGYNQRGPPREKVAEFVELANMSRIPILALDLPTGLDPDEGIPNNPCIRAKQTLTLALPKTGLVRPEAKPYVGDLFLADISVPREYYFGLGVDQRSLFTSDFIIPIEA